ncbi:MAG: hypothetical protein WA790_06915 [Sulfitobacter sp.]
MLGLFILPALLGIGLIWNLTDDDDDEAPVPEPEVVDVPDDADLFQGTAQSETINARDAGGEILAGGGNDIINGSDEVDIINGERGNDVIFANGGDDVVAGGQGDDRIFLGDGDDESSSDEDDIAHLAGNDFIRGGAGNDFIMDALGSNTVFGDLGSDSISVVDGLSSVGIIDPNADFGSADFASGGFGNDEVFGDDGDTLTGGQGEDVFGVVSDLTRAQENVEITDFNTSDDTLAVVVVDGDPDDNIVTFNYDETRGGVIARAGDTEVAVLQGLTEADIEFIRSELIFA